MFTESAERVMCSSHQVAGRGTLHGHNWRIVAVVEASSLSDRGFVLDGVDLGAALWSVIEPWDHRHLNDVEPFSEGTATTPPSIARVVAERLASQVEGARVRLARVEVHPDATRCATWTPPR